MDLDFADGGPVRTRSDVVPLVFRDRDGNVYLVTWDLYYSREVYIRKLYR
ncbi:hypothetical protein AKJ08_1377 [Vulgatibacter incomptus]|uniref:Uncharacterized protein n=1 Tax=Vulgatibacter incomptus TaxID=1391653 RepID=A0A0K1PBT8_9BACT|nr:hypothetical protein AKJ08_1377 [Vulgatibacter incomptus]